MTNQSTTIRKFSPRSRRVAGNPRSRCAVETLESRQLLSAAVSLATTYNRTGIVVDHSTFASNGGFDAGGNALSSTLLGASKTWNGNTYTIGTTGHANVVTATGQT